MNKEVRIGGKKRKRVINEITKFIIDVIKAIDFILILLTIDKP